MDRSNKESSTQSVPDFTTGDTEGTEGTEKIKIVSSVCSVRFVVTFSWPGE